jgi:general secretion pathway protein K
VNTASRAVLAAVLTADPGAAERLVQSRERSPFSTLAQVQAQLGPGWAPGSGRLAVQSAFFEVHGRVRLGERVLEERSLVERRGERGAEVVVLRRERRSLPAAAPAGP